MPLNEIKYLVIGQSIGIFNNQLPIQGAFSPSDSKTEQISSICLYKTSTLLISSFQQTTVKKKEIKMLEGSNEKK